MPDDGGRAARIDHVHELAAGMPHVTVVNEGTSHPVHQVGGTSFVFFRTARADAFDPVTGERYRDVVVLWVGSEADKQSLLQDPTLPFFTTPHFDGHLSVLFLASRVGEVTVAELTELVQEAWLSRALARRAAAWLGANPLA